MCGVGKMNFYLQGDQSWKFYLDGGDGKSVGDCYRNAANKECANSDGSTYVSDLLVCYSYVCGHA